MSAHRQLKFPLGGSLEEGAVKPRGAVEEPSVRAAPEHQKVHGQINMEMMEQVVSDTNIMDALEQIEQKKRSAPGVDGMKVPELREYLITNWTEIREQLLKGSYEPQPVRRTEIPKDGGGKRPLGIPTVLDRLIQQALLQQLTPVFDPAFSERSYGFRPGRNQKQAIYQAQEYMQSGREWVVDMDLSKFFDRVNHDMLMARIARKIKDKRILLLIRKYLKSGVMVNGILQNTEEGAPQGGSISPLLSNIVLDDLDRELERRGHTFVRYADDFQVYVNSQRAGERVMDSLEEFIETKLKLKVNREKSAVDRVWKRAYLGVSFYKRPDRSIGIRLAPRTLGKLKWKIRKLTCRRLSISMEDRIEALNQYLRGWLGYYKIADAKGHLTRIMSWIRRRLRMCKWKQWKSPKTRVRKLRGLGLSKDEAKTAGYTRKGYWISSLTKQIHKALDKQYWLEQGLTDLVPTYLESRRVY